MKAIVLTFDKNQEFTDHMICKFDTLWPTNPFTYYVPYQSAQLVKRELPLKYVKTAAPIVETVLSLLAPIPDREWIFWCMDDHFPLKLDTPWLEAMLPKLHSTDYEPVWGVNFCASFRKKRIWRNQLLRQKRHICIGGDIYVPLADYNQIWLPQFIRAGALRNFFAGMPEPKTGAKEMDSWLNRIPKPKEHLLLLTGSDRAVFAESSAAGLYTTEFLASAKALGRKIDKSRLEKGVTKKVIRGRMGLRDIFEKTFIRHS